MPSEKILDEKKKIVSDLAEKIKAAKTGVFVDYKGITVSDDTALRRKLRSENVEYAVVKNTLTKLALKDAGIEGLDDILNGTTALAISSSDLVAPAKVIAEYAGKHDNFQIKAGFVEGKVVSVSQIKELSKLPAKEVLISMVLAGFNAPISGFVNVLNGNLRGLACALNAIAEKKAANQ
ncbi:MAG: 50S ribosomal protein L10 [Bacillota bacterium]|nr:50S ribosomal protein L10 [Bacillota bacterium]